MKRSTTSSASSFRKRADAFRACVDRLTDDGVDLAGYTLPQRVDDLEAARKALGYERIDLLSESAGTRTAMIYAWRYPASIRRSVMMEQPAGPLPLGREDDRRADRPLRGPLRAGRVVQQADAGPRGLDRLRLPAHARTLGVPPIAEGHVEAAAFFGLMSATTDGAGPLAAPWTIDTLLSAEEGGGAGAWLLSLMAEVAFPSEQLWGDVASVARADSSHARFFATDGDRGSVIGTPADLIWVGGELLDAWPASPDQDEYAQVRDSNVETLLIGGALDVATPPQWATRELLPHLPNGREVVLENIGHTDDFWTYQPEAGTELINGYLATGQADASRYTPTPVDFTPP